MTEPCNFVARISLLHRLHRLFVSSARQMNSVVPLNNVSSELSPLGRRWPTFRDARPTRSIYVYPRTFCVKVRLRQWCGHREEHRDGETEWVEHPECLQTSMGRLDPAESGEEGGGTLEGKGTSFYFHQGQTPGYYLPDVRGFNGGIDIPQPSEGRIIGITSEFIRILEILRRRSRARLPRDASVPSFM